MSFCNRRHILLGLPALLAACGFEPALAPGSPASRLYNTVLIDAPSSRLQFLLTRELETRLGRGSAAQYGLSLSITMRERAVGISSSDVTTRFNLLGSVKYALRDFQSKAVLITGAESNFVSYGATGTTVATQAAERDAQERLMVIMADQIMNGLISQSDALPA
ncbi:MAG: LPS assembly lipoprotein LptE [Pseudomonadota bacterium]